jgi:hypothetical protein
MQHGRLDLAEVRLLQAADSTTIRLAGPIAAAVISARI